MRPLAFVVLAVVIGIGAGCGTAKPGGMSGPTMSGRMNEPPPPPALQSNDILAREVKTSRAQVKHILISWRDLDPGADREADPRARARSRAEADALVAELRDRLRAGEPIEPLMAEHSEDPGSAASGESYEVVPGNELVLEFRQLGLRLDVGEVGVVLTQFGWHIIQRVE